MAAEWCKQQNLELDTELSLSDAGRSAFKGHHLKRGALGRFIALAQAGALGSEPILLVEAIDRVSRQEPLDALDDLLLELVKRCGVTIVTLEDGQIYSRETLRDDPMALLKLAMLTQAAHQYSRRLSGRLSKHWAQVQSKQQEGKKISRGRGGMKPFWLDADLERDEWVPNSFAPAVVRAFELLTVTGMSSTADALNREGYPAPKGKKWNVNTVVRLSQEPAVMGTLERFRTSHDASVRAHRKWVKARDEAAKSGAPFREPEPEIRELQHTPDFYPAVVSRDVWDQVQTSKLKRDKAPEASGHRGRKQNCILQGMVRCEGDSTMGFVSTSLKSTSETLRYLKCRARRLRKPCACDGKGWRMEPVIANVLTRISHHLLEQAVIPGEDRRTEVARLKVKVDAAALVVADAQSAVEKAQAMFEEAMDQGSLDAVENITGVLEKRRAAERKANAELERLKQQQLMLQAKARPISSFQDEKGMQLLRSVARESASDSEIARLREVLQHSELRVQLKGSGADREVGLRFGPGDEWDWAPFNPQASQVALMLGASQPAVVHESKNGDTIVISQKGFTEEEWAQFTDEDKERLAAFAPDYSAW